MDEELLTIKAIASIMGITIAELSERSGIPYERLLNLNIGRGVMNAKELMLLSKASGIPAEKIRI